MASVRKRVTPPMNSKGVFVVQAPFRVEEKKVYEVIAIREITDLWDQFIDVYAQYYQHHGISESEYKKDANMNVAIVSLLGEEGVLHIPDTYILSYPELSIANYQHVVLSVSLGAIDKRINLEGLKKELAEIASKMIGVKAQVQVHVAPTTDALTIKEAKQLEKVREGMKNIPETSELLYQNERKKNISLVQATNAAILKAKLGKG